MTLAAPGVLRRRRAGVPFTLVHPISFLRPVHNHGQFVVDAVLEHDREVREMKYAANRLRGR